MIHIRDIGNSNAHYRFYTFDTFLKCQKELGVRRVDLFGATPHVWIDAYGRSDGREIRKKIESYGLSTGIFMPEFSSMRYCLGSEGSSWRKTQDYLKQCMEFGAGLEVDRMVITADGFLMDRPEEDRRSRLAKALEYMAELAKPYEIRLLLLNHYGDGTSMIRTKEDMAWCMKLLEGKDVGTAVDVASVYEAGESLADWFTSFEDSLSYVCLSNTKFDGARHYWGDGYLNPAQIAEIIDKAGYTGYMGCHYMIRDYLKEPWKADERTWETLGWAFGEPSGAQSKGTGCRGAGRRPMTG